MSFAVVLEGMTLIAYLVIMLGGKQKREQGWKVLSGCLVAVGGVQAVGMGIIVGFRCVSFFPPCGAGGWFGCCWGAFLRGEAKWI